MTRDPIPQTEETLPRLLHFVRARENRCVVDRLRPQLRDQ